MGNISAECLGIFQLAALAARRMVKCSSRGSSDDLDTIGARQSLDMISYGFYGRVLVGKLLNKN